MWCVTLLLLLLPVFCIAAVCAVQCYTPEMPWTPQPQFGCLIFRNHIVSGKQPVLGLKRIVRLWLDHKLLIGATSDYCVAAVRCASADDYCFTVVLLHSIRHVVAPRCY